MSSQYVSVDEALVLLAHLRAMQIAGFEQVVRMGTRWSTSRLIETIDEAYNDAKRINSRCDLNLKVPISDATMKGISILLEKAYE